MKTILLFAFLLVLTT